MKNFEKYNLSEKQLAKVKGGYRSVVRIDQDGDGKWDRKEIYKNGLLSKTVQK